jgi:hypothetical protein
MPIHNTSMVWNLDQDRRLGVDSISSTPLLCLSYRLFNDKDSGVPSKPTYMLKVTPEKVSSST